MAQNSALYAWSTSTQQSSTNSNDNWSMEHQTPIVSSRIPKISELEMKPWQYIGSGSIQVKVPGYSYMTEEEVRNSTIPHSSDSFDYRTYSQTTAYEQYMARNMKEWSDNHREETEHQKQEARITSYATLTNKMHQREDEEQPTNVTKTTLSNLRATLAAKEQPEPYTGTSAPTPITRSKLFSPGSTDT